MSTSITELLPAIVALSNADKVQLVQLVLAQLAQEDSINVETTQQPAPSFDPRQFFGVTHQSKQVIDDYLATRGCLKHYANPSLIAQEQDVWQTIVSEKHEHY